MASAWTAGWPGVPSTQPVKDRRFAGEPWSKDPRFEAVARTYLAQTDLLQKALDAAPLDERSKAQWGFALRQVADALSPANTLADQPGGACSWRWRPAAPAWSRASSCSPRIWRKGRISMTDDKAFEVGGNVCTTPGSVIFQNELIQLIQYTPDHRRGLRAPAGDRAAVHQQVLHPRPAAGELLRRARGGRRATRSSWCPGATPVPAQEQLTWDDYIEHGVLTAIDVALADHRRGQGQHPRLLRGRHAAGQRAGGPAPRAVSTRRRA